MAEHPLLIAPSILSADFARLADEVAEIEAAGADWLHVDVMDGRFVPNLTIGPPVVKAVAKVAHRPLDVHLMIVEPDRWIDRFASAGAATLTVHAEADPHLWRTLEAIREAGMRAGVALDPATPLSAVEEAIAVADQLLLMTVEPGFGGQPFIGAMLDKVRRARDLIEQKGATTVIEVDGGVDPTTAGALARAGASVFVAGSAIFGQPDRAAALAAIRRAAAAG